MRAMENTENISAAQDAAVPASAAGADQPADAAFVAGAGRPAGAAPAAGGAQPQDAAAPASSAASPAPEAPAAPAFEVVLASGSPRREQLLRDAGVVFTVRRPQTPVDESLEPDLAADPPEAAKKLAERKAGAVVQEILADAGFTGMVVVLGADTMVVKDGRIFGKPKNLSDGKHMLRCLSGATHQVVTAVSVWMVSAPSRRRCRWASARSPTPAT